MRIRGEGPIPARIMLVGEFPSPEDERAGLAFQGGPGMELANLQCLTCHSADYISTQPRLSRTAWRASVQKMKDKYGAPIPTDKMDALAEYLVKNYGAEIPKP